MVYSLYFSKKSYLAGAFTNTQRVRLLVVPKRDSVEVTTTVISNACEKPKVHEYP